MEDMKTERTKSTERKALFEKVIAEAVKDNKKKKPQEKKASREPKCGKKSKNLDVCKKNKAESSNSGIILWTFEEFVMKEFNKFGEKLLVYLTSLYTHLPTRLVKVEVVKEIIRAIDMFHTLGTLFHSISTANEGLREAFYAFQTEERRKKHFNELQVTRTECLQVLKYLRGKISLKKLTPECDIRTFCLRSATLTFCTVSSSAKLHIGAETPLDLLIVDEAAQLKECESNIPLQLPGLRHAVLIGDERQLPAMVQSKVF
jgi:senataxin